MIVADASVIVEALGGTGEARDALLAGPVQVPHIVDAEVANALRGRVMRGVASPGDAATLLGAWIRFEATRHDARPLLPRVWALRDALTAYDAMYVALAESLGSPLLTADRLLAGAPGPRCEIRVIRPD
jgi:predicted nucleic acid-binding protein